MLTATSSWNALVDLIILGLPIWRIWRLAVTRGRKWGLSGIFALGALYVCSFSIFKSLASFPFLCLVLCFFSRLHFRIFSLIHSPHISLGLPFQQPILSLPLSRHVLSIRPPATSICSTLSADSSCLFPCENSGCLASLLRVYYTIILIHTPDLTYAILPVGFTALIEFASAMLVACLPVMPAFNQHVVHNLSFCLQEP